MDVKYDKDNLRLILLCSLPSSCIILENIFYSHDTLTFMRYMPLLFSKRRWSNLWLDLRLINRALLFFQRTHANFVGGSVKDSKKSRHQNKIYNYCKKNGHIKFFCYKLQINKKIAAANKRWQQRKNSSESYVTKNSYNDGKRFGYFR